MRRAGIDKITRMRIMGHKTDAMDIRYGVVEDGDVIEARPKLEEAFQAVLASHPRAGKTGKGNSPADPAVDPEVLSKLARLDSKKLKALLTLFDE